MIRYAHHQHLALSTQLLAFWSKLSANGYELTAAATQGAA